MCKRKILLIAEDPAFIRVFCAMIQDADCDIYSRFHLPECRSQKEYHLILLNLDHVIGLAEISRICNLQGDMRSPILMISPRIPENDKIVYLQEGVSAILEKPIGMGVCLAQTYALLRLGSKEEVKENLKISFGPDFTIDSLQRIVLIGGKELKLTQKEFDLLFCMAESPDQVFSRAQLYQQVWGDEPEPGMDNTVKTHIAGLRKKLSVMGKKYIRNVRGVGYKFIASDTDRGKD